MKILCPRCGGPIVAWLDRHQIRLRSSRADITITCRNVAGCGYRADDNGQEIEEPEAFVSVPEEDWNPT